MGAIREIIGAGTIFGIALPWLSVHPMLIIALAPGGFFVYAIMIAAINHFTKGKGVKGSFDCRGLRNGFHLPAGKMHRSA